MGKRIKLIYILSLFSALMAISVQAYWLYNQYRYEVERYADEIAADVLRVGDEEFAERRKMAIGDDTSYIIDRSSRTQSGLPLSGMCRHNFVLILKRMSWSIR